MFASAKTIRRSTTGYFPALLILLLLMSCSHDRKNYRNDPHTVPGKAWQKPYTVNGERYQPLSSHEGFVQSGVASWYGSDFHGRKTSSGEPYDMNAMTAAHKTLPIGVHVRVSNVNNGRETVVRINDRGPFVAGRIIDLSYTSAKQIGIVETGTAPVRIVALGYADVSDRNRTVYKAPASYDTGSFGIQVGSFNSSANARKMYDEVKQRYGYASMREVYLGSTLYYRVSAGNYRSLKEAERVRSQSADRAVSGGFVVALD